MNWLFIVFGGVFAVLGIAFATNGNSTGHLPLTAILCLILFKLFEEK
ncbi:hypothetical protein [Raoultibacter timonensis]|nr:hypothetical protein [Raoultibacter timonensis]